MGGDADARLKEAGMNVAGEVLVADIMAELGIEKLPSECRHTEESRILFDDVLVDDDDARDGLSGPFVDEPEWEDRIDKDALADLATAIRCGERVEAELLLDRLFDDSSTLTHQIQLGRYRQKARLAA